MKTLEQLSVSLGLKYVCGSLDREITGCYAGDLLSWVMSNAQYGDVWITIMSNVNVVAVASLTEAACVVLAEGVELDSAALEAATAKDITVFSDSRSVYELCCAVGKFMADE
ncbi:MAG: AraC family transcriptional regulator [Clostridia bacterium]|nr:AraC family transcriptional regulator [Clostridia bacterium]